MYDGKISLNGASKKICNTFTKLKNATNFDRGSFILITLP